MLTEVSPPIEPSCPPASTSNFLISLYWAKSCRINSQISVRPLSRSPTLVRFILNSMICVPLLLSWAKVLSVSAVPSVKLLIRISGYFSRNFLSMSRANSRVISCRVPIGNSIVMPMRALSCVGKNSVLITGISIILPMKISVAPTITVFRWRTAQFKKRP